MPSSKRCSVQLATVAIIAALALGPSPLLAQESELISPEGPDPTAIDPPTPSTVVAGEVIVRFRPGISQESRDQVLAMVDGIFLRSLGSEDVVLASVPVGTEVEAAESLGVDTNVIAAEPNGLAQAEAPPADSISVGSAASQ